MNHKQLPNTSGIHIENTISMAVQNRNHHRSQFLLILIAFCGAFGGIFTFLSMFHPTYHTAMLVGCLFIEFVLCTLSAISCGSCHLIKCFSAGAYILLLCTFRKAFCDGFIYLANIIYKVVYLTDWDKFTVTGDFTEEYCTTVFFILVSLPIICLLSYSVIHFQNLFLCLLSTFPYVEIGFYMGAAPNHFFAIMLFAFWVSMGAVHLANSGAYHKKEQNSFLRRDNVFFPVSSMRFMVTEKIGFIVLCIVMIMSLGIDQLLQICNYQRSEQIKKLRSDAQTKFESMDLSDPESIFNFPAINNYMNAKRVVVRLGRQEKQEYKNVSISGLTFSELPEGRIYLKYLTGEVYQENTWSMLPLEEYENSDIFELFQTLDYYPQDFLYENVKLNSSRTLTMTMHNLNQVVSQSVPYGFMKNAALTYQHDNRFTEFATEYKIIKNQNYESILQNFVDYDELSDSFVYYCREQNRAIYQDLVSEADTSIKTLQFPVIDGISSYSPETVEALILCEYGYRDFVYKHHTAVPDTEAMQNVRAAYSDIIGSFNAQNATISETLELLQTLREAVSDQSSYTLSPGKTPADQDFVEYFLFENQKGYCMHYATAGVILARMAGIPARYCEGYLVDCTENNTLKKATVNGKSVYTMNVLDSNAHAWVEFYVNGWGWIPLEFTYTQADDPEEPLMTETTTKHTSVSTAATSVTSPVGITTMTTTESYVLPDAQKKHMDLRLVLWIAIILLIIASIPGIFYLLWKIATKRRNKTFSQKDRNKSAICIYQYLLRLMRYCGVNTSCTKISDIAAESSKKCDHYLGDYHMEDAIAIAAKAKFSHHTISPDELTLLLQITKKLARSIYDENGICNRIRLRYIMHLC